MGRKKKQPVELKPEQIKVCPICYKPNDSEEKYCPECMQILTHSVVLLEVEDGAETGKEVRTGITRIVTVEDMQKIINPDNPIDLRYNRAFFMPKSLMDEYFQEGETNGNTKQAKP